MKFNRDDVFFFLKRKLKNIFVVFSDFSIYFMKYCKERISYTSIVATQTKKHVRITHEYIDSRMLINRKTCFALDLFFRCTVSCVFFFVIFRVRLFLIG